MTELAYHTADPDLAPGTTRRTRNVIGLLMTAGGLMAVAGSFLPWASIVEVGGETGVASYFVSGLGDYKGNAWLGLVLIGLGMIMALCGADAIRRPAKAASLLGYGAGVAVVIALLGIVALTGAGGLLGIGDVMTGLEPDTPYRIEPGLWLVLAGAAVGLLAGVAGRLRASLRYV